jgi:type VI secretion system protein ImpC
MIDADSTETDSRPEDSSGARIETNITTGPTEESQSTPTETALPFRLLFVSPLTPQAAPSDWSEEDRRHELGPKTAADLQAELGPEIDLEIPNRLSDHPDTWTVSLSFPTREAFAPKQVAHQMAPTARLLEVRSLVQAVRDEKIDAAAFREKLDAIDLPLDWADDLYRLLADGEAPKDPSHEKEPASPPKNERDDALGRVMDMVDTEAQNGASRASESEGATKSISDEATADRILARLDERLAAQVEAVLTHSKFRQLEAAWRGLHFLESHVDLSADIDLLVLPARRDDLHKALHHQVLLPEHDESNDDPPTSLVMVDHTFGHSHVDVEQLADLAGTGESLQTPIVTSARADFFGLEHVRGLARLPSLRPHLQGDEYVEWERLRSDESSSFLSLALPSVQLRPAHRGDSSETALPFDEDEGLFGSGALAVGVAAAQSYADTGWPTHLTEQQLDGGASVSAQFTGSMQSELARAGFTVVDEDGGGIRIVHAPSVHEPTAYDDPSAAAEARTKASLPCRLFLSRVAHRLFTLKRELDLTAPLDTLQKTVTAEMETFLNVEPPKDGTATDTADADEEQIVRVDHVSDVDLPNQEVLAVRLRPPNRILSADARLAMVLRVPA